MDCRSYDKTSQLFCEGTRGETQNYVPHLRVTDICSPVFGLGVREPQALEELNTLTNSWGTVVVLGVDRWLLGVWLGGVWEGVSYYKPSV